MSRRREGWPARRARDRVVAWALAMAWPLTSHAAPPEPAETSSEPMTAGEWYARGIELAGAGDYSAAAAAFLESYELQATPEALFNAALAYENAGQPILAIATYRHHLAEPGASPDQAGLAAASIDTLMREVVVVKSIRFDQDHPPAEVWIGGELRGLDDFPLMLMPGEIDIRVVDQAGLAGEETRIFAGGDALELDIRPLWPKPVDEPIVDDPPPLPDPDSAERRRAKHARAWQLSTWTSMGLTGASGVAIAVAGGLALGYRNRANDALCDGECVSEVPDVLRWEAKMQDAKLATNVAIGVGAGLAVVSLTVGLIALRATRRSKPTSVRLAADGLHF